VPTPLLKKGWIVPDALWALFEPLLPPRKKHPLGCHRKRVPDRKALNTIIFSLRSGTGWNSIEESEHKSSGQSAYRRFREWTEAGVMEKFWRLVRDYYDKHRGLNWKAIVIDGSITKAQHGGEDVGPNPTDRRKGGTKRSLITDADGIPLGIVAAPANQPDYQLVSATLESMAMDVPTKPGTTVFLADKGYDVASVRRTICAYDLLDGIIRYRKRKESLPPPLPKSMLKGRYVVERTHSWMHAFSKVKTRRERHLKNYMAMLHLTMALVTLQCLTGGRGEPERLNRRRDHRDEKGWKKAPRREKRDAIPQWTLPGAA
jgi:putative transposase